MKNRMNGHFSAIHPVLFIIFIHTILALPHLPSLQTGFFYNTFHGSSLHLECKIQLNSEFFTISLTAWSV